MSDNKVVLLGGGIGFLLAIFFMFGCSNGGPNVKLYVSDPAKGGLVRSQANEVIPYVSSKGYIALSSDDAKTLLDYCLGPQGVDTKSAEVQQKIQQISQNGY